MQYLLRTKAYFCLKFKHIAGSLGDSLKISRIFSRLKCLIMKRCYSPIPQQENPHGSRTKTPLSKKSAALILSRRTIFDPFHFLKNLIRMQIRLFGSSQMQVTGAPHENKGSKMAHA